MSTVARITTWSDGDNLTATALNAEFDNILDLLPSVAGYILTGFSGSTTAGLVYYVDSDGALQLAGPTDNLWGILVGVGTGETGEIQVGGKMTGLSLTAGVQYMTTSGVLTTTRPTSGTILPVGIATEADATVLYIFIQPVPYITF